MSTEEVKATESNNEAKDEVEPELDRSSKEEGEKDKEGHASTNDDKKSKKKLTLRFGKKASKKAEIERLKKLGLQQQYIKGELQPANSIIQPNSPTALARSSSDVKEDPIITTKDDSHIVDQKKGLSFLDDEELLTDRRIRRSKSIGEKDFKELKKEQERIKVAPLSPEINAQISAPSRPPRPARSPATIKEPAKEAPKEMPKEVQKEPPKEKVLNRRSSINLHPEAFSTETEKEEKKDSSKDTPISPKQERKNTLNNTGKTPVKQTETKTVPAKVATKAAEKPEESKEKAKTVDFILPEKENPSSKAAKTAPAKDNVSKIMNSFNKSAEEPAKPTTKQTEKKPPGKLSDDRAKIFSKPEPEEAPVKKSNTAPKLTTPTSSSKPSSAIKEDPNRSLSPSKGRPTKESAQPAVKETTPASTKSPPPRRPEPSQDGRAPTPNSAPNTPKIPPKPNKGTSFIKDESKIPEKTASSTDSKSTSGEAERRQRGAPSKTATLPQNGREATSPPPTANAQNRSKTAPVRQGPPVPSLSGSLREKKTHGDRPIQVDIGKVPLIVTGTVQYLDNQALDLEGLYRESANATQLKALRQAWETRQNIDLSSIKDPHTVAGLLKLYFREMYTPIPRNMNRKFLDALDADSANKIKLLRSAINSLADEDKNCLTYLFAHLKRVCDKSGTNKMSAGNLGVCWAPTLFGNSQMIEVVQNLITNYDGIFVEEA